MKPLFILLGVFLLSVGSTRLFKNKADYQLSGKLALALMLVFTAIGHFMFTQGMAFMLPEFVPNRREIVYLTGLIEIAAAAGIFIPNLRKMTGILLIIFLVVVLPANIYASFMHLNYETGNFDGNGVSYLWFRIPFQLVLIAWTYIFTVK